MRAEQIHAHSSEGPLRRSFCQSWCHLPPGPWARSAQAESVCTPPQQRLLPASAAAHGPNAASAARRSAAARGVRRSLPQPQPEAGPSVTERAQGAGAVRRARAPLAEARVRAAARRARHWAVFLHAAATAAGCAGAAAQP